MRFGIIFIPILVLAVPDEGLGQAASSPEATQTVKAGELTLKIPKSWQIQQEAGTLLTAVSLQEGESDLFRENLRVHATPIQGHPSIDDLFLPNLEDIRKGNGPLKLESSGTLTCNGHRVQWMSLGEKQTVGKEVPLTMVEYGLVHRGKSYSFKFMAEAKREAGFRPQFEAIMKTLEPRPSREEQEATEAYGQGSGIGRIMVWVIVGVLVLYGGSALFRRVFGPPRKKPAP